MEIPKNNGNESNIKVPEVAIDPIYASNHRDQTLPWRSKGTNSYRHLVSLAYISECSTQKYNSNVQGGWSSEHYSAASCIVFVLFNNNSNSENLDLSGVATSGQYRRTTPGKKKFINLHHSRTGDQSLYGRSYESFRSIYKAFCPIKIEGLHSPNFS